MTSVDLLYLHLPDHKVPIEDTLAAVQKLYEAGKFKELVRHGYKISHYATCRVNTQARD